MVETNRKRSKECFSDYVRDNVRYGSLRENFYNFFVAHLGTLPEDPKECKEEIAVAMASYLAYHEEKENGMKKTEEDFFKLVAQNQTWDVEVLLERLDITWDELIIILKEHANTLEWSIHNQYYHAYLPNGAAYHELINQEITFKPRFKGKDK